MGNWGGAAKGCAAGGVCRRNVSGIAHVVARPAHLGLGLDGRRNDAVDPVLAELFSLLLDLLDGLVDARALVGRRLAVSKGAPREIAGAGLALGLLSEVLLGDLLVVGFDDVFGHSLHAEDLDVEVLAAWDGILDVGEVLLVNLAHVDGETSGSVQAAAAAVAFEVLCLLVGYQDLEVVKVALAVVAPWSLELLVDGRESLPLFSHCEGTRCRREMVGVCDAGRGDGARGRVLRVSLELSASGVAVTMLLAETG